MKLEQLKAQAEALIQKIEDETDGSKVPAVEAELEAVMKSIKSISKAQEARRALPAGSMGDESTDPLVKPKGGSVIVTEAKAVSEMKAFHKFWSGEDTSDNEKALIKVTPNGVSMPAVMKTLLFGPVVAKQMGWLDESVAKAITPWDASGASLIPRDYVRELSRVPGENMFLMDRTRVRPAPHGNLYVPRLDRASSPSEHGVEVKWIQSGSSKHETEPEFEQLAINCHEIAGIVEVYDRMITRSMIDLMAELADMFRSGLKHAIDVAIINGLGDAANQPTGVIGYAGIGDSVRETLNEVSYADLINVKHATNPRVRDGGMYLINNEVEAFLEGTLALDGRPLFAASVASGPYDRLCGFPYMSNVEINPAIGQEGDVIYMNPRYYTTALEDDVKIVSDGGMGLGFRTNRTLIKAFASVGGRPIEPDAFAVLLATT
jgi:HK97 family phage major capsid protein